MIVGIIGGGFTGLVAGLRLAQAGHKVEILEKEAQVGGLAGVFKLPEWDWSLEQHYHHWFTNDSWVKKLVNELGLTGDLMELTPETSVFVNEEVARLDSPIQPLKFKHLSVWGRIRVAGTLAYLKLNPRGVKLENKLAAEWLTKWMGKRAYGVLFQPLFESKFGPFASEVNAAWFWARIYKRTSNLMYFRGGYGKLLEKLVEAGVQAGVRIITNTKVEKVVGGSGGVTVELSDGAKIKYDRVLVTTQLPVFLKIMRGLPEAYTIGLRKLKFLWAQNLVLTLKKKSLEKTYWLNINDSSYPFVAQVNHTNFVSSRHYGEDEVMYLGNYLPDGHAQLTMSETELITLYLPYLQKISPKFKRGDIRQAQIFRSANAQPVVVRNYSRLIPQIKTPIERVYLANMSQVYPWDRGTNYAIEWGEKVAKEMLR